jgi:hypothetical protein
MLETDQNEAAVYRRLQQLGGCANVLSLHTSVEAIDALQRLEQRGLVRQVGFAVEIAPLPTREAKTEADQQRTQQRAAPVEPRKSKMTHGRARKAHYRPLKGLLPDRVRQMASRIVNWIQAFGDHNDGDDSVPVCNQRALARGLHASRFPAEWADALSLLAQRGSIKVLGRNIALIDQLADEKLPSPYPVEPEPRKQRRKRPLSEWVKNKIRERGGQVPLEW